MSDKINNILRDLYQLEPGLAEHEKELVRIVEGFLACQPDTKFDARWAEELRAQLLSSCPKRNIITARPPALDAVQGADEERKEVYVKGTPMSTGVRDEEMRQSWRSYVNYFRSMTSIHKYAGVALAVVLVTAIGVYSGRPGRGVNFAFVPEVIKVDASNAFGPLTGTTAGGLGEEAARSAAPLGLGGSSANQSAELDSAVSSVAKSESAPAYGLAAGRGQGGGGDASAIMPAPYQITYKYTGDPLTLSDQSVPVLRRVRTAETGGPVLSAIEGFDFGLVNLKTFNSSKIQNLSFVEDKDFGYAVNVSFTDGSISIYENWEKWSNPYNNCQDEECYNSLRLSESDVPADDELIRITDEFLASHNIPTDNLAKPEVDNRWRNQGEGLGTTDKSQLYIPDAITVRYPLIVNGATVYEQGGEPVGLMVGVNIRFDRVSSIWGLTSQRYESSDYAAVADAEKVIAYAERGGSGGLLYYYGIPENQGTEKIEASLGTPEKVLMRTWNYQSNQSNELLVPALRFPVTFPDKKPGYYPTAILVPLAEELFRQAAEVNPPVQIMKEAPAVSE